MPGTEDPTYQGVSADARAVTAQPVVSALEQVEKNVTPFARKYFFTDVKIIRSEMKAEDLEFEAKRMASTLRPLCVSLLAECRVLVATTAARAKELKRNRQ
eukprot:5935048-Alexandrium_andersonii.AAC.1